jgi:23S rRNA pseudouridine1911/1915/1917 synthase
LGGTIDHDMSDTGWRVDGSWAGVRLDKFLAAPVRLGSRGRASTALHRGKVFVNDVEVGAPAAGRRLQAGDTVRVWMDRPGSARRREVRVAGADDLRIVYQDDAVVVVNKPSGLLTVPLPDRGDASVSEQLLAHFHSRGKRRPLVVHRIDRDTSGLVMFAMHADAHARLKAQFKKHEPERVYLAVVYGHPSPVSGTWRDRLVWDQRSLMQKTTHPRNTRGRDARSEYRVIETFRDTSLIEVRLITGKRNQIRLQARLRGHTLVGERRYVFGPDDLRFIEFPRQALHAHRLGFLHPVDGRPLRFEAPLPADLTDLIARLRHG